MLQNSSELKGAFKLDFCPTNAIAGQTQFYLETIKKKEMVTGKNNKQTNTENEALELSYNLKMIKGQNYFHTSSQHHFFSL